MTATTFVQIFKAVMLWTCDHHGRSVLLQFGFSPEALFAKGLTACKMNVHGTRAP
jgi:Na+(H+)/acetate symporter ActP